MKKEKCKLFKEFKAFINRGNVLDLAVGMIIGSAFTAIVTALVKGILQPLINMIPLGTNGQTLQVVLKEPVLDVATGAVIKEAVIMDFGALISAIITFILTAIVLFAIIKVINKAKEIGEKEKAKLEEKLNKEEEAEQPIVEEAQVEEVVPVEPQLTKTEELLEAILAQLQSQNKGD